MDLDMYTDETAKINIPEENSQQLDDEQQG